MEMGETILLNFLGNIKRVLCIRVLQNMKYLKHVT